MTNIPEGFPLDPEDSEGSVVNEGDTVKILCIPNWLIHDLDEESQAVIRSCEGSNMLIDEIDEYGYVWVEEVTSQSDEGNQSNKFCMGPKNVLLQS